VKNAGVFMNRSPLCSRCVRFGLGLIVFFACEGVTFARTSAASPDVSWPTPPSRPATAPARGSARGDVEPLSRWVGVCRLSHHPRDGIRARACPLMMAKLLKVLPQGPRVSRETAPLPVVSIGRGLC